MKVLLVDDEPMLLRDILFLGGHAVTVVTDGSQALDILATDSSFHLIILDLAMPVMDGWKTLCQIRGGMKLNTYIIMITANNMEESLVRGLNEGADEYLVKPLSPKRLLAHLAALERRLLQQENLYNTLLKPGLKMHLLTARENEIINLIHQGLSNAEIAEKLVIAETTVKNHLGKIYRKLGVKRRSQAVFAVKRASKTDEPEAAVI